MPHPRFLKYKDVDQCYRFQVTSTDGSILFISKAYKTIKQRDRGIELVQEHHTDKAKYELDIAEFGYSVFHFAYSRYGRIGTSIQFNSMAERDAGIKRFMNSVAVAGVEESN